MKLIVAACLFLVSVVVYAAEPNEMALCLQGKKLGDSKDFRQDITGPLGIKVGCEGPVIDVNVTLVKADVSVNGDVATILAHFDAENILREWRDVCRLADSKSFKATSYLQVNIKSVPFRPLQKTYSDVNISLQDDRANSMAKSLMINAINACF